jgi:hypothetical protein
MGNTYQGFEKVRKRSRVFFVTPGQREVQKRLGLVHKKRSILSVQVECMGKQSTCDVCSKQ